MVGTVGRTDLLGSQHQTVWPTSCSITLHDRILRLPHDVAVYPTYSAARPLAPGGTRER